MDVKLRHTLYKRLFISEADAALIRSDAITILNQDNHSSVCNAYIEATLAYLYEQGLLSSIELLDADAGPRKAHLATHLKRRS